MASLQVRRATRQQVRAAIHSDNRDLYRLDWQALTLADSAPLSDCLVVGGCDQLAAELKLPHCADVAALMALLEVNQTAPSRIVIDARHWGEANDGDRLIASVHHHSERALVELQALLADTRLNDTVLLWLTCNAVAAGADDGALNLLQAPLWGLLRSARTEQSERVLRLLDVDTTDCSGVPWASALLHDSESELALRRGQILAARLQLSEITDSQPEEVAEVASGVSPEVSSAAAKTVLITGGMGEIGQALARHLVDNQQARHLLLTSRRGMDSPGAASFVAELQSLGAESVTLVACDVSDREQLAEVIHAIPAESPLTAVYHLAGVLDDGVITDISSEQLHKVLRPKVDGAWHLHQLTEQIPLTAFVLFSSTAGVMGGPGQANYAAANSFLDALASQRQRQGLVGTSLAWGLWQQQGVGMTAHLGNAELSRMRRSGMLPLSVAKGLELLDLARLCGEPLLLPMRLQLAQMQRQQAPVPCLFRALVRPGLRRASASAGAVSALRQRLLAQPEEQRLADLSAWVQETVALVMGLAGAQAVLIDRPLKDLGMDSLMAVELRNQLAAATEIALPATLAFDYPTPQAIAALLLDKLQLEPVAERSEDEIRAKLSRVSVDALKRAGLLEAIFAQPDISPVAAIDDSAQNLMDAIGEADGDSLLNLAQEMLEDML